MTAAVVGQGPSRRSASARVGWALLSVLSAALTACGGGGSDSAAVVDTTVDTEGHTLITLDRGGFSLLYDCTDATALRYDYTLTVDTGNVARPSNFTLDTDLPVGCAQQKSTGSYASVMPGWDRGHLVTSNHMDDSLTHIEAANLMSNIVPQVSTFNQGIWLDTENVAECYRDLAPVHVVGGVTYNDPNNDFFIASHGIRTPDRFWKVIVTTDSTTGATKAIAWSIPNQFMLNTLDTYLVSIDELAQQVGSGRVGLADLPASVRSSKPSTTWPRPAGCSSG